MDEENKDLKEQVQEKKIKAEKTDTKPLKETVEKEEKAEVENIIVQEENIKEEKEEVKVKKEDNKKKVLPIIILTVLICLLIFFSTIFALININNDKIFSNIKINGVDLSGLTQQEAMEKLQDITDNKLVEELTLKHDEYETTININQINAKYDIENAVNQAYNIGRAGNIISNNYAIIYTMLFEQEIELPIYYDEEELDNKIKNIASKIPGAVVQSSYYIENENLIIVKGKAGLKIEEQELKQEIIESAKIISTKYNIIEIQTKQAEPYAIDVEKIREEIYKEPQDAYVTKNPTTVHAHVNGVDFKISIDEAKKVVEKDKKEYKIPLKITVPSKTINDLGEEAFPDQLATYTTRYDVTNYNRSNNLTISAKKIDGTVIMPGEVFSYNQVVGERTIAAGYKAAGAFAGGKVVQSVGGGICQISSTLYNTALLANLEITDRSNHAFLTGYVAASRDATVSWGTLDFKFKNTRSYPIKIEASAKNGICKISMYGIKEETEYEVVIQSKVLSYIPYTVKYVDDKTLEEGKEVVEQEGQNGCTSEAYRILKLNGKVISQTLLSKDTYDPMQRIVRRGTKKVEVETNQVEE